MLVGAFVASGASGLIGCGEPEVRIRGKVPTVTARTVDGRELREAVGGIDQLQAFPLEKGLIMPHSLGLLTTADVGDDGGFEVTLRVGWDWMLVLVDTDAEGPQRFVGYVGATVSADNELIALPTAGVEDMDLDLGVLSGATDTWTSGETVEAATFELTASALADLARADAAFKNVKNLLINFDGEIVHGIEPSFGFTASGAPGVPTDPASYVLRDIWGIQTNTNSPRLTVELLCDDTPPLYALTPPGGDAIVFEGQTCTDTANGPVAMTPGGLQSLNADWQDDNVFAPHLTTSWGVMSGEVPVGDWTISADGDVLATFDIAVAKPADDAGKPVGVVPSVRVNTTAGDDIASIDIEWYTSTADGYSKIQDLEVFTHILTFASIDVGVGEDFEQLTFDPRTTTSLVPTRTWNVGADAPTVQARVFLGNGGVGRVFISEF